MAKKKRSTRRAVATADANSHRKRAGITDLPAELLQVVAKSLPQRGRAALAATCRAFRAALHTDRWAGRVRLGDPARASRIVIARHASLASGHAPDTTSDPRCRPFPLLGSPANSAADHAFIEQMANAKTFELVTLPSDEAVACLAMQVERLRHTLCCASPGQRVPLFPNLESLVMTPTFVVELQDYYTRHPTPRGQGTRAPVFLVLLVISSLIKNLCVHFVDVHGAETWPAERCGAYRRATREVQLALAHTVETIRTTWPVPRLVGRAVAGAAARDACREIASDRLEDMYSLAFPLADVHDHPLDAHLMRATWQCIGHMDVGLKLASTLVQWQHDPSSLSFTAHGLQAEVHTLPTGGVRSTYSFAALPPRDWRRRVRRHRWPEVAHDWVRERQVVGSVRRYIERNYVTPDTSVHFIGLSAREVNEYCQSIAALGANLDVEMVAPAQTDMLEPCAACGRDDWVRAGLVRTGVPT